MHGFLLPILFGALTLVFVTVFAQPGTPQIPQMLTPQPRKS